MPRYPKKPKPERSGAAPFEEGGPVVRREIIAARRLITVAEDHGLWKGGTSHLIAVGPKEHWAGAIVRLRPPGDVDEERLEAVKLALTLAGVARLKVELRRGVVLPTEAVQKAKPARSSAREVIMQLVAESNSADVDVLLEIVEKTMAEEGI